MDTKIIDISNPLWVQTLQELNHDVYHLPEYVYLDSQRTLSIPQAILIREEDKLFFLPYLLRRCDDLVGDNLATSESFDVVSPYGYPGMLLNQSAASSPAFLELALNQLISIFRDTQICSAFFRLHPLLNPDFHKIYSADICQVTGETVSVDLHLSEEEIWSQTRSDHRKDINRLKRAELVVKIVPFELYINEFIAMYQETMARAGAAQIYYFDYDFFASLLTLGEKLHLGIVESDGQMACGCLITECDGIVQTYLGGTKQQFLKQSPDKLLFDYVRFWAKKRGNKVFHLGGGVGSSKDGVYNFKAGFSKRRHNFLTMRIVTDEEKYRLLVELRAKALNIRAEQLLQSNFFPAYRTLDVKKSWQLTRPL